MSSGHIVPHPPRDRQQIHEDKLALSQKLRQLSSQKRLKECIDLYESAVYDKLRDAHHGSIVVDCCARCGDIHEAERILGSMLVSSQKQTSRQSRQQQKGNKRRQSSLYFWENHKHFSYKHVPIQAWTALLKGYVHSGVMAKAYSLFQHLCDAHSHRSSTTSAIIGHNDNDDDDKSVGKLNRKKRTTTTVVENGPNVRTFNTLLRGCLWTATSIHDNIDLVGGIVTADRAWLLCENVNITCDSSSYEYYISMLSQSLQCQAAETCLRKMRNEYDIRDCSDDVDSSIIESYVVCLVVIARGHALLGKVKDVRRCTDEALRYLDSSSASIKGYATSSITPSLTIKQTTGGKKAWRESVNSRDDDGNLTGRREESNRLFRSHRQAELRQEALVLQGVDCIATKNMLFVAQMMLTRLLYFSGGGTTDKDAIKICTSPTGVCVETDTQQWINSLWYSFGLREIIQSWMKRNQSTSHKLDSMLSKDECNRLIARVVGEDNVMSDGSGIVDFTRVFKSLTENSSTSQTIDRHLHIELGAGSGDWACLQAKLNPSDNYVTVELRADRVAQTFTKCLLHQDRDQGGKNIPLMNICCVGSECGMFLRERVAPGSVNTIFVNHPEPPTQTYNDKSTTISADEPAHMLNSQTILSVSRCLEPMGKGMLVVVTDNLIYARFICHSLVRLLEGGKINLIGLAPSEVRELTLVETFSSSIHMFEGRPSLSIRHHTPKKVDGGHSYFDRLWRTGAGKHAEMKKRYIIGIRTKGGIIGLRTKGGNRDRGCNEDSGSSSTTRGDERKSAGKKRSLDKQMRRNERRLLKKQQLDD